MCSSKSLSSPGPTSCSVRERALGNRYRVAEDFGPSGCAASADWPVPPQLRRLGAQQRKPLNWIQRQMGHRWTPTEDLSNEEMASLENSSAQLALKSCPPDPISAAMQEPKTMAQTGKNPIKHWRRGRDSNPRYRCQYARLAIRPERFTGRERIRLKRNKLHAAQRLRAVLQFRFDNPHSRSAKHV